MHFRNGRAAKNGDVIAQLDQSGNTVLSLEK